MKLFFPLVVTATWSSFLKPGTLSATAECWDDDHYRYKGYHWKDCQWVHENDHCEDYDNGHEVGKYYCPNSCHNCYEWDDHWDDDYWHEDDHWDEDDHHDDDHDYDDHHDDDWHHDDDDDHSDDHDEDDWYHECRDDERYRHDGDKWKNCQWVADEDQCDAKRDGKHVGKYYCPDSCHYCSDWEDSCSDDKHFRYEGDHWKDCDWIYDNDCCDHEQNGKHIGKYYCQYTCDYCDDWHKPEPTKKPTKKPISPTRKPTKKPTRRPTKKPTRQPSSPTRQPSHPTRRPTSPSRRPTMKPTCSSVEVARDCYDIDDYYPEKVTLYFENCNAAAKDWIGIYEVQRGTLGQTLEWWGNSYMWKFACGSRSCSYAEDYGTVNFRNWWNDLSDGGEYKAYLFEDNGYHVKASSDMFEVGHCSSNPNPPNTKPTRRPTPRPTRRPTGWSCHSSVEVEQYCYKNQHPSRLEVTFENCHPTGKDWIGIYDVQHGSLGETLVWWGNSYLWQFLCGSDSCDHPEEYGTLYFDDWWMDLNNGQYRAYLFENDGYHVKAFSETFKVGNCW